MNIRLLSFVLASATAVAALPLRAESPSRPPANASQNIDRLLAADWQKNGIQPNPPVSDEVFVRRVYLDVAGRIPTYRETVTFLESKDLQKRSKLIDTLLASDAYEQNFYHFWSDILRAQTGAPGGEVITSAYLNYIKDSLRTNLPYDKFVLGLVGAQGTAWDSGGIGYYMRDRGMPLDNFANTARIFLGTRIECAQCHNHPFDKWKQMDFFRMSAFTSGISTGDNPGGILARVREIRQEQNQKVAAERKANGIRLSKEEAARQLAKQKDFESAVTLTREPMRNTLLTFTDRPLLLPRDYQYSDGKPRGPIGAATMFGTSIIGSPGENHLAEYAQWMTSPENPRFTKVIANRLWKKVFGRALIEPLDELRDGIQAVNPELMDYLEKLMVAQRYDMKGYLRVLLNTQAYQRAVPPGEIDGDKAYHFPGPVLRRMTAEQMWDSFVTLVNPTPDMKDEAKREASRNAVLRAKKLNDALELLTTDELFRALDQIIEKSHEMNKRRDEMAAQMETARAAGNSDEAKTLAQRLGLLQISVRNAVNDLIYAPALQRLAAKGGVKEPLVLSRFTENDENTKGFSLKNALKIASLEEVQIPGYDTPALTPDEIRTRKENQEKAWQDEAANRGITGKAITDYVTFRQTTAKDWLRASELPSPAPRGHYLREFGQSDREVIENANPDASVPQALALMNGTLLPRVLDHYSPLMLSVNQATDPNSQTEAVYMTLLSRRPTDREKQVWAEARANRQSAIEDLIYAVLNTRQFIFLQ